MKKNYYLIFLFMSLSALSLVGCHENNYDYPGRPEPDPEPIPAEYSPMLFNLEFENNITDSGNYKFSTSRDGGLGYSAGKKGNALSVTGNARFKILYGSRETGINMKDTLAKLNSFTLSVWLKPGMVTGAYASILSIGTPGLFWGPLEIFYKTEDYFKLTVQLRNGRGNPGPYTVPPTFEHWLQNDDIVDKWNHFVLRYNGKTSKISLFLNGVLSIEKDLKDIDDEGTATANPLGALAFTKLDDMMWIGGSWFGQDSWAAYYRGQMDELRFYRTPISDEEITSLYNLNY